MKKEIPDEYRITDEIIQDLAKGELNPNKIKDRRRLQKINNIEGQKYFVQRDIPQHLEKEVGIIDEEAQMTNGEFVKSIPERLEEELSGKIIKRKSSKEKSPEKIYIELNDRTNRISIYQEGQKNSMAYQPIRGTMPREHKYIETYAPRNIKHQREEIIKWYMKQNPKADFKMLKKSIKSIDIGFYQALKHSELEDGKQRAKTYAKIMLTPFGKHIREKTRRQYKEKELAKAGISSGYDLSLFSMLSHPVQKFHILTDAMRSRKETNCQVFGIPFSGSFSNLFGKVKMPKLLEASKEPQRRRIQDRSNQNNICTQIIPQVKQKIFTAQKGLYSKLLEMKEKIAGHKPKVNLEHVKDNVRTNIEAIKQGIITAKDKEANKQIQGQRFNELKQQQYTKMANFKEKIGKKADPVVENAKHFFNRSGKSVRDLKRNLGTKISMSDEQKKAVKRTIVGVGSAAVIFAMMIMRSGETKSINQNEVGANSTVKTEFQMDKTMVDKTIISDIIQINPVKQEAKVQAKVAEPVVFEDALIEALQIGENDTFVMDSGTIYTKPDGSGGIGDYQNIAGAQVKIRSIAGKDLSGQPFQYYLAKEGSIANIKQKIEQKHPGSNFSYDVVLASDGSDVGWNLKSENDIEGKMIDNKLPREMKEKVASIAKDSVVDKNDPKIKSTLDQIAGKQQPTKAKVQVARAQMDER